MPRHDIMAFSAEKKCHECKKLTFIPDTRVWAYKITCGGSVKWFCSWGCLCRYRQKQEKPKALTDDPRPKVTAVCEYPNNLRAIRQHFGLTQQDVLEYVGCHKSTYSKLERGVIRIIPARMEKLTEGFGCTEHDILARTFDISRAEKWECRISKKRTDSPR